MDLNCQLHAYPLNLSRYKMKYDILDHILDCSSAKKMSEFQSRFMLQWLGYFPMVIVKKSIFIEYSSDYRYITFSFLVQQDDNFMFGVQK